jgi:FkbM family methyltransferase
MILRATQPLAVRQAQLDERLLAGLDAVAFATSVAQRGTSAFPEPLEPGLTTDVSTSMGDLFVHAADRVMTPFIHEHGFWEASETAFLRRVLTPGATFVDVGANIGYFSVLASALVGGSGRVIAVEPERRNLALLKANLWRNGCGNAIVLPIAAYRHTGFLPLVLNEDNRGDHQVGWHDGASALVPCARLDDLLGGLDVDVIKIDTQGVDHDVIAGLLRLIRRPVRPTILCEFWLEGMERRGVDPGQVATGYRELGFELALLRDELGPYPASPAEVVAAARAEASRYVNVVLRSPG